MVEQLKHRASTTRLDPPFGPPPGTPGPSPTLSFELVRRLDDDRTNEVYEATCAAVPGRVVVQLLRRALAAEPSAGEACQGELAQVARLRHPHIAWIHSLGVTTAGVPYVMREYVDGETLRAQLFRDECMTGQHAIDVVKGVAAALAAAHQAGALHGELRPSKIFLIEATGYAPGFVKLVDFAQWRLAPDRRGPAARAGLTRFTAPELITGRRDVDGRADQFSLAAILYRMLSGVDAFPGDDVAAVLKAVVREAPAPLRGRAGYDPVVDAVLRRALAKDPRQRFDTVLAFAAALEQALVESAMEEETRPVAARARPAPPPARSQPAPAPEARPAAGSGGCQPAGHTTHSDKGRGNHRMPLLLLTLFLSEAAAWAWWTDWRPPPELAPEALWRTVMLFVGG